tara:strand:- start:107 stop:583 length:477 start_codon:yes stop_codon:yes gene_type:complete
MSKSYAQMADEILNGALTNPDKNPYDPAVGHQAHMPTMDPNDKLVEMNDAQRHALIAEATGNPAPQPTRQEVHLKPTPQVVTPEEVDTLHEALRIIKKIQEATTVGSIGVNMAGGQQSPKPKKQKLPGDVNVCDTIKKRAKKAKPKNESYDFLSYLKA